MNSLVRVLIAVVLAVWIFCLGLVFGTFKVRREFNKTYEDSQTVPTYMQYDTTEAPTEETTAVTEIVINMVTNQPPVQATEDSNMTEYIPVN